MALRYLLVFAHVIVYYILSLKLTPAFMSNFWQAENVTSREN